MLQADFQIDFHDPHQVLGLHELGSRKVIRLWRPGATQVYFELFGKIVEANQMQPGLFEYEVPLETTYRDYRIYHKNGLLVADPYAFWPTLGELDLHLFNRGVHYELYHVMGGRLMTHQGIEGVKFAVWAPSALKVSLVGDFNHWDGRETPMRVVGNSGIWELFIPGVREGEKYKFEIVTQEGNVLLKSDPFAHYAEFRPNNASIVFDVDRFAWNDSKWMQQRGGKEAPILIYEVHLGSWKQKEGQFLNYRELAPLLASYCKEMGFTHVELLPIMEHPLDESWGYQVSGFFAVTSRFGTPEDFQYFVNYLHAQEIGIILDWVPAHFPNDPFSLAHFDGTSLFEHADPRLGFHPHWHTCIFNYGRYEVSNFLMASALFWLDKMHIDGLRLDAAASMLYLDYGRENGEWIPNRYGGKENIEAIEFMKHLNAAVHSRYPNAWTFAEESTAFPGVTTELKWGGLGFDFKWNLGWMHDTLEYFKRDSFFRRFHQNELTFGILYAFSEHFTLALSHDEVVHGKSSLLSKMPGDDWQKFANLRLLYSYFLCQPGKKLFFMGGEIGQWREWHCKEQLDWYLLQYPAHLGLQTAVRELNHFYLNHAALWTYDFDGRGFEWVDMADIENSVLCYLRKAQDKYLLCVHHFTATYLPAYTIHLRNLTNVREVMNTDRLEYGGSGKINERVQLVDGGLTIQLAPLATHIFEVEF